MLPGAGEVNTGGGVWAAGVPHVVPAVLGARPAVTAHPSAIDATTAPTTDPVPDPVPRAEPAARRRFGGSLPIGRIACWQLALALVGATVGRPLPVAGPAMASAAVLVALTVLRVRDRLLYQWAAHYLRFRRRERGWYLPKEDGPRAVLHLFAPDAMVGSIPLDEGDTAVVNRVGGTTAILRPELSGADPVMTLPRPGELLAAGEDTPPMTVQLVFHGLAGSRRTVLAWLAVQAVRTPTLLDEDDLGQELDTVVRRVRGELAGCDVRAAALGRDEILRVVTSLAHVGEDRRHVSERWRRWQCGPVVQAAFRLQGWATLPDPVCRQLLTRLLTATTEAVTTVSVVADGGPVAEVATMRVAAASVELLNRSVKLLRAEAAGHGLRLDRMDGEHADGVAGVLPLGAVH